MSVPVNPCVDEIIDPVCDPCLDNVEHGRIRGIAYIHKSYKPTLEEKMEALKTALASGNANDITTAKSELNTAWTDGISAKSIFVIPETIGTFDGGQPVEGSGYGDSESRLVGYSFVLSYKDPSLEGNEPFYNTISRSNGWYVISRTESLTRISNNPVTIIPKSAVTDDTNSEVVWDVEVKWKGKTQPKFYKDMVEFFVCPN